MKYDDLALKIIKKAKKLGADEAEVYLQHGRESEVSIRMGEIEILKQAGSQGLGLRIFKDEKLGFAYTSDFSADTMDEFVKKTVSLTEPTTADEFNGLPKSKEDEVFPDLDLYDPELEKVTTGWKIDAAKKMEKIVFDFDKRVTNSHGASVYDGDNTNLIANSKGVLHTYKSTYCYLYCAPVAEQDEKKQTGYWYTYKRFFDELESPEEVAKKAAFRTVRMLGAEKAQTQKVPVVFDPLVSRTICSHIFSALNGDSVYKKASFLVDKIGERIASPLVTIVDDGLIRRGLGSRPFDGEGIPTSKKTVIDKGVLKMYFYDTYTANKVGTKSTGNAQRGYSGVPSIGPMNLYLKPGTTPPEEIIKSVKNGLYVTRLLGFGVDTVNGDYSRGANGIWIENGELAYPVHESTIASTLMEILQNIEMVGNDIDFRGSVSAPTIKISEMTVSGGA